MSTDRESLIILMAEDDPDDRLLTIDAFKRSRVLNDLTCVEDGEQLLQYLRNEDPYADPEAHPRPHLILLDLNMPRMDGREALREMKADANLRRIPVIVLTTSDAEEDLVRSYELGAASYIRKPVTFEALVELMQALGRYWVEFVRLPPE